MEFVRRRDWKAQEPRDIENLVKPVPYVFIHRTGGDGEYNTEKDCVKKIRDIQHIDMDLKGHDDIGYNFIIGGDGRIYIGRGFDRVGKHILGYNKNSLGIAFMGDFMKNTPSLNMINAGKELVAYALNEGYLKEDYRLYGHRIVSPGTINCPGNKLYNIIREWPHFSETPLH